MALWTFWKREKIEPIKPPPPTSLTRQQFADAQRRYIEKYDKLVRPDHVVAIELLKLATEYGKITVTYLVIGNAGGLAALLAIYPLLRDSNQIWLVQQLWVAAAFVAGLFLAVFTAAVGYLSFLGGALYRWNLSHQNDTWIRGPEFELDHTWVADTLKNQYRRAQRADRISIVTTYVSFAGAILSGLCWSVGALLLAWSVMASFPPA